MDLRRELIGGLPFGNRESVNVRDGNTITYDVNELTNRYASVGGSALEYDAAGNLTKDRLGYGYSYDYENGIAEINDVNGTVVACQGALKTGHDGRVQNQPV